MLDYYYQRLAYARLLLSKVLLWVPLWCWISFIYNTSISTCNDVDYFQIGMQQRLPSWSLAWFAIYLLLSLPLWLLHVEKDIHSPHFLLEDFLLLQVLKVLFVRLNLVFYSSSRWFVSLWTQTDLQLLFHIT